MKIHYITKENHIEAMGATRAILHLYNQIITFYGSFVYNFYKDEFDAFKYIQCRIDITTGETIRIDLNLLHQGSAVALLCKLYNFSCKFKEKNLDADEFTGKVFRYLEGGAFDLLPLAKDVVSSAREDGDIFKAKLRIIYEEYILGYYRKITSYRDETCSLLHLSHFKEKLQGKNAAR